MTMPDEPSFTHLRVYERQGPIKLERTACGGRKLRLSPHKLTNTAAAVDCGKCRRTRWFKEATALETDSGAVTDHDEKQT